ncbi:radial spoke head 10 B family protein, putative [Acanthamoeba castellanii str. Neff]|uniref:Radial spoke head 10 B family protein, putative n=1 Tax=Acanthamoeba castellanii (strain ATCC 30010 / Neff) TaxID=1257118 RepID=L8HE53_ACACF|nr:radial spoke head 10 B family protein, putative [Acanthamoeba castellanii str. Neff]ELR22656.1 radial spoke head 10 B family protein, putative [Acanthamoeba castellanii str. Neff]
MLGGDNVGGNPHPQMYGSNQPQHIAEPYVGLTNAGIVGPVAARAPVDIDVRDVTYRGEYKDGRPHGRGYKVWVDGDWYDGEWRQGRQHGRGIYCCPSGRRYEGEWKDGLKHGKGVKIWANGDRYEGEWREGTQHGKGIYIWANGDRYEGGWKDGNLHGHGSKTWWNDNRYEGEWKDDVKHGYGVKIWANGDRYEGEWREGTKHGKYFSGLVQELQVLERTLERSRALVSTRISIMNSRVALAEKSRCLHCSEKSKEVVFVPCGHRALCQACATPVLLCPVCDVPIASKVVSYDT